MAADIDVLQGTLDMLVLKTLTWRAMHGYDILDWLRRTTDHALRIEDAALYPALHRLEARGLVDSEWGVSANNRKARFYTLTPAGRRALKAEAKVWERYVNVVGKVMTAAREDPA
jgi:transcriptional regulator